MRRPVKPFVTEYKGNARRPPSPSMKLEEDTPSLRVTEPSRFVSTPNGEDSYEAALRAADALFAGHGRGVPADTTADVGADGQDAAVSPTGGRILRVIDEAPPQELIDLETERAPKRRGRKPGSKNKPKIPQGLPPDMPRTGPEMPSPVFALMASRPLEPHANLNVATADKAVPRPALVATGSRRGERYAWVRTQLKPGQSWKRHLPKVIW